MELPVKQIAGLLKVLANENRLLILCELMKGPRTVGAIGEKIHGITQSALSQHLALLKAHGILDCKKMGMNVIYAIGDRRVEEVIAVLKIHFCSDEKENTQ